MPSSLLAHTCFFTAFIVLCLMELLSQKPHKPAEKEKCFLLSAEGCVKVYIIHAACNGEDAES